MPRQAPTYRPVGLPSAKRLYERSPVRQADKDFYRGTRWLKVRDMVRAEEPLCRTCLKAGQVVAAEAIDHILDRKSHPELAYERSNLQGLCKTCHNAKRSV